MKQSAGTSSSGKKTRRKSREELNQEGRDRKRARKHRGHKAGSRANPPAQNRKSGGDSKAKDPRTGSKKRVPLEPDAPTTARSASQPAQEPRITAQAELTALENDERLDSLLDRLEAGETLSSEEQTWLDETLDRIDKLMMQLGIALDEDQDGNEESREDIYRLLKGGH